MLPRDHQTGNSVFILYVVYGDLIGRLIGVVKHVDDVVNVVDDSYDD